MDARDRLRRYLEQRRQLGESEFVLDDLSVDEAMRILGAAGTTGGPGDWRAALRDAGADPGSGREKPGKPRREPPPADPVPNPLTGPSAPEAKSKKSTPRSQSKKPAAVPNGLVVGAASGDLFSGEGPQFASLDEIAAAVAACTKCGLYKGARNPVPGEGSARAEFMCIGEAPGAKEDETGRPFVGQAGQLLTKILAAIDLKREDVFIGNVLKHRPPGNRNPLPEEVKACSPYLIRQIELIRPKVILAMGTFAAQTLLDTKLTIGKLRGQIHRYYGVPLIVTYHPAALLRNPSWKRPTWEDVQLARRILDDARARG